MEIVQLLPQFDWRQHQFSCLVQPGNSDDFDGRAFRVTFQNTSKYIKIHTNRFSATVVFWPRKSTPPPVLKKPKFTKSTDLNPTTKVGGGGFLDV